MPARPNRRLVPPLLAAVLAAVACTGVRYAAYPPEFTWLPDQQVDGAMRLLARDVAELDDLLKAAPVPTPEGRARVLALLGRMEGSVASLETPGQPLNHPLLERHLPRFRASLQEARAAVEAEPPSYFRAGRVSGSCLACHVSR